MLNFVTAAGNSAGQVDYLANHSFTAVELQVLRLAHSKRERPIGSAQRWLDRLTGRRPGLALADPRLEALRSYAAAVNQGGAERNALRGYGYGDVQIDRIEIMMRAPVAAAGPQRERLIYGVGIALGTASLAGFLAMTGILLAGI